MPLNIKDDEIHEIAKRLAALKQTSITTVVREALTSELRRTESSRAREQTNLVAALDEIAIDAGKLRVLDNRSPDEILAYDSTGLPS
ncbi:MAG: type II toxin-antitoxin system VapB family antitoxin [Spirochaetales bacterium]